VDLFDPEISQILHRIKRALRGRIPRATIGGWEAMMRAENDPSGRSCTGCAPSYTGRVVRPKSGAALA
jgi:hypothetical protein